MIFLKICCGTWDNASRDKREMSVCRELGMETLIMAKGQPKDKFKKDSVSGFDVLRFSTRPLGTRLPNGINRVVALFTWAHYARSLDADIISGHDLSGLLIGYMSNMFKPESKKAMLIYDSHEFELGRNAERGAVQKFAVKHLERFLMKRCAFSIMVNDSIADEVQRIHKLKDRPVVVRNSAPMWERDDKACTQVRREFYRQLNVPEDAFWVMYHGGVMQNRGVENMLRALALKPNVAGVILGNGEGKYMASLKELAQELGVSERVLFHPAVPVNILKNYVGAVDCGLVTVPNACMSYYYMLPNKFFENIQSETPIVGSNFPEIHRLVSKYDIGLLCDPADPEDIAAKIEKMKSDKEFYVRCKANTKLAKQELCWENERKALIEAYRKVIKD